MISKDAEKALNDLDNYSILYGKSRSEVEGAIAEEAKDWLIAYISKLESQLISRDTLIKKLVEAGDGVHRVATIYRDGDEFDEVAKWERLVTKYRTAKARESEK